MSEFEKFALSHNISSTMLSSYASYINPSIIEERKMNKYFRIHDYELLSDTHFPVKALFDMVQDFRFKDIIKSISCNRGFGENYGACVFWNDYLDLPSDIIYEYAK